jgi:hypothetical protein
MDKINGGNTMKKKMPAKRYYLVDEELGIYLNSQPKPFVKEQFSFWHSRGFPRLKMIRR